MTSILPEDKDNKNKKQGVDDMMKNPRYMQECAMVINDALRNGFDVLQLENGNIVTTGTKIVVYEFEWDEEKQEMIKILKKKPVKPKKSYFNEE